MIDQNDMVSLRDKLLLETKKSNKFWMKLLKVLVLIFAVGYTIMPADFIPDAIPFIGVADDTGVWIGNLLMYVREIKKNRSELEKVIKEIGELIE